MSHPEQISSRSSMAAFKTTNKTTNSNSSYDNQKTSLTFFYNIGNTKFEGCIVTLKTFIYDFVGIRQSELYVQTTKEIGDKVSKTLKNFGNDASETIQFLEQPAISKPGATPVLGVDDADDTDARIWEKIPM